LAEEKPSEKLMLYTIATQNYKSRNLTIKLTSKRKSALKFNFLGEEFLRVREKTL
jgi:hypothetical protein